MIDNNDKNKAVLADMLGTTVGVTDQQKAAVDKASDLYNAMSPEFREKHTDDINNILKLIMRIAGL